MLRTGLFAAVLTALWLAAVASGNLYDGWVHALVIVALAAVIARLLYALVTMD